MANNKTYNEIWIEGKEKSISRSTVDLAYRNGRAEQESCGFVSGPRKLGVPGSRSYLYTMFLRFGVITSCYCSPELSLNCFE